MVEYWIWEQRIGHHDDLRGEIKEQENKLSKAAQLKWKASAPESRAGEKRSQGQSITKNYLEISRDCIKTSWKLSQSKLQILVPDYKQEYQYFCCKCKFLNAMQKENSRSLQCAKTHFSSIINIWVSSVMFQVKAEPGLGLAHAKS